MDIVYIQDDSVARDEVLALYADAGWTAYTDAPDALMNAIKNSTAIIAARVDKKLVGLIRAVTDGYSILYIQDILVLNDFKRKGIGSALVMKLRDMYKDVRQTVLLTDGTQEQRAFYESLGLVNSRNMDCECYISFLNV